MAFKPNFNLSAFWTKESKNIIKSYKNLMTQGRGVLQDDAPRKQKNNRKPWLVNTGETRDKGFDSKHNRLRLLVFASGREHSGKTRWITKNGKVRTGQAKSKPTHRQIFRWHNKGISSASGETYSGVFGQLPVGSKFEDRLRAEVSRQTKREILRGLRQRRK